MNIERTCLNCTWVLLKEGNRYVCVHPCILESVDPTKNACVSHQFDWELERDISDN